MARIPENPKTWAEAYRKVHLEDAARKKEQRARAKPKKRALVVTINGMNCWQLPNGKRIGSWHGTPPNGAVSLGKGWWLDMRTGETHRQRQVGKTFTVREVDDYHRKEWNRTGSFEKALKSVERKYGSIQADRIMQEEGTDVW